MLYGSAIKNYAQAGDIDIMAVIKKREFKDVRDILKEKQKVLPKKIHSIELTDDDLLKNIKKKKGAILDIVKTAVILHGQEEYVEIIKNATSF